MKAKIAFFQTHDFDQPVFQKQNERHGFEINFLEPRLVAQTADLARGHNIVCSFANDNLDQLAIAKLKQAGVKMIALRCAGFNHVDIEAAVACDIPVVRVPAYSPHAIAEHTVCLLLAVNRKIHRAYMRIQSLNFSLEGLVGVDLFGKTVGVIGTGKIGSEFAKIMLGFGCRILAYDMVANPELNSRDNVHYVNLDELYKSSDVVSLHVPLTPQTFHMINEDAFAKMKNSVIVLNTGRGALIDSKALIEVLKAGKIRAAGLDVYEEEEGVFFEDLSTKVLQDDTLARLLTFPNVLITSHQAFLTEEALQNIAQVTLDNIKSFVDGKELRNKVSLEHLATR